MKAIIFDMDGLMIDSERLYFETEREMAKGFGKDVKDETLWKMMGRKQLESITIYKEDLGLEMPAEELLRIRNEAFEKKLVREVIPMNGLLEVLNEFKGKLILSIATGSADRFVKIVMEKLDIENFFDIIQTSEDILNGKPDPEIYTKTINRLKLLPEECIVLEDSSNGALAGKRAGCYTIAVPSEYTKMQDFNFVDYIANDLKDASNHIKSMLTKA